MKRTKGLGKGLDALLPPLEKEDEKQNTLPLDSIEPLPDQPRRIFEEEKLEELARTIREKGVLSPVIVRPKGDGRYQLISGERRWRASRMAGLNAVPAIIKEVSDREAVELALIENIQRENLSPIEEARAYQKLLDLYDLKQEDLSKRLGKDRSTIANSIRLLKLPEEARIALEENRISAGHARCILSVPIEFQQAFLEEIIKKGLSVRAAEKKVKQILGSPKEKQSPEKPVDQAIQLEELRKQLRSVLSTQVKIVSGKRKGKIIIEYYNPEDLNRLTNLFLSLQ